MCLYIKDASDNYVYMRYLIGSVINNPDIPLKGDSATLEWNGLGNQGSYSGQPLPPGNYTITLYISKSGYTAYETNPLTITVIELMGVTNATETNVTGSKNWASVKNVGNDVIVEAFFYPTIPDAYVPYILEWEGGSPVDGNPRQRKVSKSTSGHYNVTATAGSSSDYVDIWVIWSTLTVTIGAGDSVDSGNDASGLFSHNWPSYLGGGNNLGPIDHDGTPSLTYAYTIGKIQAKAVLSPAGIENVVTSGWHMKRTTESKAWDNAGHYVGGTWQSGPCFSKPPGTDDTSPSGAGYVDLDPSSGTSTREIYDLDAPGCSCVLNQTTIYYTSETYANFVQYAAVTLDTTDKCSDEISWSYQAWVDMDKAAGQRAEKNELKLSHITIPGSPHYSKRSPAITGINPNNGPTAGGTNVTISGSGFTHTTSNGPTVTIGGNAATNVTLVSTTSITCTTPSGTAGSKNIVVTMPDGQSDTLTNGFTYNN